MSDLKLATIEESGVWRHVEAIDHRHMTCVNHPTARYITKNPHTRTLHFIKPCEEAPQEGWPMGGLECPCPFSDLRVIMEEEV